jgi:putative copper resistance protein D
VSMTDGVVGWDAIRSVLMETSFGEVSIMRFVLATVVLAQLAVQARSPSQQLNWLSAALCAGLAASLAGMGHTQISEGIDRIVHTIADGLHLLAAGAWLGGLVALLLLVAKSLRTKSTVVDVEAGNAALRFSGMGYVAVATLIGSGLINSWFLVGSFANLTSTPYGQLLLVKLLLFAGMLTLAALNRFIIVPKFMKADEVGEHGVGLISLPGRASFRLFHHFGGQHARYDGARD